MDYEGIKEKVSEMKKMIMTVSEISRGKYDADLTYVGKLLNNILDDANENVEGLKIARIEDGNMDVFDSMEDLCRDYGGDINPKRVRYAIKTGTHYNQCLWDYV